MLDELLGRAELKARIEELETKRERLERRLEAESERRADAVTARQAAEERANRLEDRIADLEGRVAHLGDEGGRDLTFRGTADLRDDRLEEVLSRLDGLRTGSEGALSAVVAADDAVPDPLADLLGERVALVGRAAPCLVYADDADLVSVALTPPLLPDPFCEWGDRFRVDRSWFRPTGSLGFALVRSDLFAFGLYEGAERTAFEGFESDVMNDHSKGGFSQARFERRRDSQIDEHLEACEEALAERAGSFDRLVVVGQRTLLSAFRERADATAAVDASGDPEAALEAAFRDFWTARLYRL